MEEHPPSKSPTNESSIPQDFCAHFQMLGVSAAVRPDLEINDAIHCLICKLSFHFITEGNRVIVTGVLPYQLE
jgi:hypothetical protein